MELDSNLQSVTDEDFRMLEMLAKRPSQEFSVLDDAGLRRGYMKSPSHANRPIGSPIRTTILQMTLLPVPAP